MQSRVIRLRESSCILDYWEFEHKGIYFLDGFYGNVCGVDSFAHTYGLSWKSFIAHYERYKKKKIDISLFHIHLVHDKFVEFNADCKARFLSLLLACFVTLYFATQDNYNLGNIQNKHC